MMKGYLTYTLAVIAIVGGLAGWFLGIIDLPTATGIVWSGLPLFGIRRAVANNGMGR